MIALENLNEDKNPDTDNLPEDHPQSGINQDPKNYFVPKLYARRWIILAGFCLEGLSNRSLYFPFSAISNITQKYYGIDAVSVNWLAMVFPAVIFVLLFPCNYFLEKNGVGITIVLASFFNALGCCIKYIGFSIHQFGYWFLLFGNIICAICSTAHVSLASKIAALWFGEKERATATAIAITANFFGFALGYLLPTSMVKNRPIVEDIGKDLGNYLLLSAILACVTFIYNTVAVKDRPKSAPSYSESLKYRPKHVLSKEKNSENARLGLITLTEKQRSDTDDIRPCDEPQGTVNNSASTDKKKCFKALLKNKYFHVILQLRGIIFSVRAVFFITLNEILIPRFPGHELEIGLMGATGFIISIPSGLIVGVLLDKTRAFKKITIATTFLASLLTGILIIFFYLNSNFYSLFSTFVAIMTIQATYYVTALDHSAEMTYPVSEARSCVFLQLVSQIYSFVFSRIAGFILVRFDAQVLLICIQCLYILTFFLSLIVKDKGPRSLQLSSAI